MLMRVSCRMPRTRRWRRQPHGESHAHSHACTCAACACSRLTPTVIFYALNAGASRNKENVKTAQTSKKPVDLGEHNFYAHVRAKATQRPDFFADL
jgi:hypothetical protein